MKKIPNVITVSRMFLVVIMFILTFIEKPFSNTFVATIIMIIFIIAGITDYIDGPLARRLNARSEMGATLDAIADMFMVIIGIAVMIPLMNIIPDMGERAFLFFVLGALSFKLLSALIAFVKYKELVLTHTLGQKFIANFLFMLPISYWILNMLGYVPGLAMDIIGMTAVFVVFLFTLEEILIHLTLKTPSRDIRHIFQVKEFNSRGTKA